MSSGIRGTLIRRDLFLQFSILSFFASILLLGGFLPYYGYSFTAFLPERDQGLYSEQSLPLEYYDSSWMNHSFHSRENPTKWYQSYGKIVRIRRIPYDKSVLKGIFWKEEDFGDRLVLSFDDGPNLESIIFRGSVMPVTNAILDILKEHNTRSVFFINGCHLAYQSEEQDRVLRILLNRMIWEGHLIGNHSYHHYNLAEGSFQDGKNDFQEIQDEFESTQKELNRVLGYAYPLLLVRPPYAEPGRTPLLDRVLEENRYFLISLQFDSYDYAFTEDGYWKKERIQDHMKNVILSGRGGILLMHDKPDSVPLLEHFLEDQDILNAFDLSELSEFLEDKYLGKKPPA